MENIDYVAQLIATSTFCLTMTQTVKPLIKELAPNKHILLLISVSILSGIGFQFRFGLGNPLTLAIILQILIDGTFGGILAAGGYSLAKK
jgi:hypothetical protein